VRTGLEFDQVQQVGVLDPTAWQRLREELVASEDSSDPAHDRGWHEDRAREAESVGDGFAARWHLDRLIAARPDDGLLHARRAAARLQGGGDASVEAELERAIALGPRDRVVDWIANRAVDLRAAGRAEASVRLLDRAVSARPDDWRLHWLRAEALAPIGRHTERQAELSRAIELGAEIPSLLGIADEWSRAGRSSEAARLYDRAINRGVVPYEAWMQAALTHLADDDKEGYRRTCAAMRSRLPANYSPIQVELHLARVCTLAPGGLGDDGRAPEWAGGRFAKDSDAESRENRVLMLRRRGAVSYRLGRYPEAINSIEQAIADSDGRVDLEDLAFLSMALCQAGDRRKALQMLTRLREDQSIRTGMSHWEAESRSQLQREAEQLIHGESFPDDVFAP
jgi:tetratricopeptide (TPR) repeat protein